MKIIVLNGQSGSGKTTTLGMVYKQLTEVLGASVIRSKSRIRQDSIDFECVLDYQNKKVAMFTMGDISIDVLCAAAFYDGYGADVLIIANSDKQMALKRLRNKYQQNLIVIQKTLPAKNTPAEQADMNTIIASI